MLDRYRDDRYSLQRINDNMSLLTEDALNTIINIVHTAIVQLGHDVKNGKLQY